MAADLEVSARMAELARTIRVDGQDAGAALELITRAAVGSVEGAQYASVTLVSARGQVETPSAVGDLARKADLIQQDIGQGPCIGAAVGRDSVVWIDEMATETRWPEFARTADGLGIRSMVCLSLYITEDGRFGALNLHSTQPRAFDENARSMGAVFAAHAAVAVSAARENDQLRAALTNRETIGQAKGLLMERYTLDDSAAFRLLAKLSQDQNIKLADLAQQVIDAGPGTT